MVVDTGHKDGKAAFFPPSRESQREREKESPSSLFSYLEEGRGAIKLEASVTHQPLLCLPVPFCMNHLENTTSQAY